MTKRTENVQFARSEPSGVGGWLLLLIAKLWFSAAVRILGGLSAGASALGMTNASGTDVIAEMGLSAANVLAGILAGVAGYLLMRKNAKGPIFAKVFLLLDAGYYLLLLLTVIAGFSPTTGDSFPAWFKPTGYFLASLIWFVYLLRSRRVSNTFAKEPSASQDEKDMMPRKHSQNWQEIHSSPSPSQGKEEMRALKTEITTRVSGWLKSITDNPTDRQKEHIGFLREYGASEDIAKIHRGLLGRVDSLCDHAYLVHIGESPTLPDTPDARGSLSREVQKWAIAAAGISSTRCLDIRAAMEVNRPFEDLMHNREYLMAIVRRNASEDGFGGKMEVSEYESRSGPEIAYMLIRQAGRDMFEAEMWARVAFFAGDQDFLNRFENAASVIAKSSLEYWLGYLSRAKENGEVAKAIVVTGP